ncbi:MAG: FKBP-type peptidyl-prolyl cis-trans isomerase [Planctomycetia bacterium]|nr:FKBP-type peptidyl-prolyl cis-trans isomerase [Planctomycetia bacterium]
MTPHSRRGWVLIALVTLSAGGLVLAADRAFAAEPAFQALDLQLHANQALDDDFHGYVGNNLKPLPRGRQKFKNVEFAIGEKFIQLASTLAPDFPEKVEGIAVNRKLTRMHFLHATGWGSPDMQDGTEIGSFQIRYDDKTSATIPIEYGRDLRYWWDFDNAAPTTRAEVAWKDTNEASTNFRAGGVGIRLFQLSWTNPHPEKTVTAFDYVSTNNTMCAPFLMAVTTDWIRTMAPLDRNIDRHVLINERARQGNVDLLFLGDSITEGWEVSGKDAWQKRYGPRKAMNAVISGDRTQHVLWRLEHGNVDKLSPKLVVLMIGTNNFGDDSAEDIAAGIGAVVAKLRAKVPHAKVLLLGVFPRGEKADDPLRKTTVAVNTLIKSIADRKMVHSLNINDKLLGADGTQDRALMPDLVHLSPQGYEVWGNAIEPKVAELLEGIMPYPDLPKKAGKIDKEAPRTFQQTDSGLRYRVLRKGSGNSPAANDNVVVDYKGWLDDGTIFDASYDREETSKFPLNGVIRGWTEGLQLISEGGMIELEIPAELGYGAQGRPPKIPANATLHFVVELLEVN